MMIIEIMNHLQNCQIYLLILVELLFHPSIESEIKQLVTLI